MNQPPPRADVGYIWMPGQNPIETRVRAIWHALTLGCADTALPLLTEDVRWRPYPQLDLVVEGHPGVREFLAAQAAQGRSLRLTVTGLEPAAGGLLVRGRQREDAPGRIADEDVWWTCRLREGLLAEAEVHLTRPVLA
jgi:hypothetical protein